jgi:hypothetical protein
VVVVDVKGNEGLLTAWCSDVDGYVGVDIGGHVFASISFQFFIVTIVPWFKIIKYGQMILESLAP